MKKPRLVAHRGASHEYPENTLLAFRKAWEQGVEAIELDVHVTRDGVPLVIHDATTKRVAGVERVVAESVAVDLDKLDVGAWRGHPGERIPSLAQVMTEAPEGHTVFIEMKSAPETARVVAMATLGTRAKIALQSYDPEALKALSRVLTNAPTFWTVNPPKRPQASNDGDRLLPYPHALIDEAKRHGFDGLALLYRAVDDDFIAAAKQAGIAIDVWTINDAEHLSVFLAKPDVRWIETDRPELVR